MKTHIAMLLDRSGSMESIAADTIGGVNTFLAGQKVAPGEATFTLAQFDDRYELLHDAAPMASVEPITAKTFVPRGSTALLDALGRLIDAMGDKLKTEKADKVVFVIVTDGEENASRTFTRTQIFNKISHQRDVYKWEFVFLGANQDAIAEAGKLGIDAGAAMSYAATSAGTSNSYRSLSKNMSAVRSGASRSMAFNDDDRKNAVKP